MLDHIVNGIHGITWYHMLKYCFIAFPDMAFALDMAVASIISYIPPSVGIARVVCSAWRSQFEGERRTMYCLRICLECLTRMDPSILDPSDVTGLAPVQVHVAGGVSTEVATQTRMTIARILQTILPEFTADAIPFGNFSYPMLQHLGRLGRICVKYIHTVDNIDSYLGSHAHWIHFLFDEADDWDNARGRRELNEFHDNMNACRWIMRSLIDTHCFTIVNVTGEWCTGADLNIDSLFHSPAARLLSTRQSSVIHHEEPEQSERQR